MPSFYLYCLVFILGNITALNAGNPGQDAAIDSEGFALPTNKQNQNTTSTNNRSPSGFVSRTDSAGVSPQNDSYHSFNNSTNSSNTCRSGGSSFNTSVTTSPAFKALLFECQNDGALSTISVLASCVEQEQAEEEHIKALVGEFFKMREITNRAIRDLLYNRHDHIESFLEKVKPVDAAQSPMSYYGAAKKYFTDHILNFRSSEVLQVSTHCTQLENIASALNAKRKLPENITYPNDRDSFLEGELC